MLSFFPGQKSGGQLSFDYSGGARLKVEPHTIKGLAHSLRMLARGTDTNRFPISTIFTDSGRSNANTQSSGKKSCFPNAKGSGKEFSVCLDFAWTGEDGNKKSGSYGMKVNDAMAVADLFDYVGDKALDLEFERIQNQE